MERRARYWRAAALLATGMAAGALILDTPAGAHVGGWMHNWVKHIRPKTDARYYTKAQARKRFRPATVYAINGDYTLGEPDTRTNGKHAELSCDTGDQVLSGGFYTGTVNNPNHIQGASIFGETFELEWWVPGGGSGGYVALQVRCLDTAAPAHVVAAASRPGRTPPR